MLNKDVAKLLNEQINKEFYFAWSGRNRRIEKNLTE